METKHDITPCLWFDHEAEDAMNFYVSVFPNSEKLDVSRYGDEFPDRKGEVLTATFTIDGKKFTALNGGPEFKFSEAISFQVYCDTQQEVDNLWNRLLEGGRPDQCGWLKDRFGLSWQIIPRRLEQLLTDPDKEKAGRVMKAMLKMVKLDIGELEKAAA